jgi:uncharacterized DUF497 family protein
MNLAFTWSESKRASNLKTHELDFAEAELESEYEIRIISFRKSTPKESKNYFNEIQI